MGDVVNDTLTFLLGDWSIRRVIVDHRDASRATFSGTARVQPDAGGATYLEAGEIRRGDHVGPARRMLAFVDRGDGSVRVDFQDGHRFLDLDLVSGSCLALHPCRADQYQMGFEVVEADRIRETWQVSGPDKDYEAETIWQRLTRSKPLG